MVLPDLNFNACSSMLTGLKLVYMLSVNMCILSQYNMFWVSLIPGLLFASRKILEPLSACKR